MQFHFGNHVLDVGRRELRRGSEPIAVEPQVFDLLLYFLQNRDRVASKDDLIASIWGGRIVSDSTLTSRIKSARNAVGDSGRDQKLIRTIARKGFRFVGAGDNNSSNRRAPSPRAEMPGAPTASPPRGLYSDWPLLWRLVAAVGDSVSGLIPNRRAPGEGVQTSQGLPAASPGAPT